MAFHYRTQGIILKKRDSGEASRIFTVFTKEYGKVSLWAQSERKIASKLRGGLELFSFSQLSFIQGKNKKVLVEAIAEKQFLAITKDLDMFSAASRAVHLVDLNVAIEERDENVWNLLAVFFAELEKESVPEKAYLQFAPQFLTLAGYGKEPVAL